MATLSPPPFKALNTFAPTPVLYCAVLVTVVPMYTEFATGEDMIAAEATVNVPSISPLPDMSKVAASSSPVNVTFLNPDTSLLASTTTAFEAATVPAVIPSIVSSSASLIAALPTVIDEPCIAAPPPPLSTQANVPLPSVFKT